MKKSLFCLFLLLPVQGIAFQLNPHGMNTAIFKFRNREIRFPKAVDSKLEHVSLLFESATRTCFQVRFSGPSVEGFNLFLVPKGSDDAVPIQIAAGEYVGTFRKKYAVFWGGVTDENAIYRDGLVIVNLETNKFKYFFDSCVLDEIKIQRDGISVHYTDMANVVQADMIKASMIKF